MPIYPLAVFCVLTAGCQSTPNGLVIKQVTLPVSNERPANGDIAGFAIMEDFLRAAFSPSMTKFKFAPDYGAIAGVEPAALDESLKYFMEETQNMHGVIHLEMRLSNNEYRPSVGDQYMMIGSVVAFSGVFYRTSGRLSIFEERLQKTLSDTFVIQVGRYGESEEMFLEVLSLDASGNARFLADFFLTKGTTVFRLRSYLDPKKLKKP
jgi:hypothetical protein